MTNNFKFDPVTKHPVALDYLSSRGISKRVSEMYNLGYDTTSNSIIVPCNDQFYVSRHIGNAKLRYSNPANISVDLFNVNALRNSKVVFITEGIFDALSVIEAGGQAIALNSISNTRLLLQVLTSIPTLPQLILSLDNDQHGKSASDRLSTELKKANIPHIVKNISGIHKDPNEALINDRDTFTKEVSALTESLGVFKSTLSNKNTEATFHPDSIGHYIQSKLYSDIDRMNSNLFGNIGLASLDSIIGPIQPQLYVLAGISSIGKTTFALQIALNMVTNHHPVLFFSFEESINMLTLKSISSNSAKKEGLGLTLNNILSNPHAPEVEDQLHSFCYTLGNNLHIFDRSSVNCLEDVLLKIEDYIKRTNLLPVVFIDYLQICHTKNSSGLKKDAIDNVISELRHFITKHQIPIFALSSVGRGHYAERLSMNSFKESGGIEFSADVALGLEYSIVSNDLKFQSDGNYSARNHLLDIERAKPIREVEIAILKCRYQGIVCPIKLRYHPAHNRFFEK